MINNRNISSSNTQNHPSVTKGDLILLLNKYGANNRALRFFSGSTSLKKLDRFVRHDLRDLHDYQALPNTSINWLIGLLHERFIRKLSDKQEDYRNDPNNFTNKLFRELALQISNSPNVLSLVQYYPSDYALFENIYIYSINEKVFLTENNAIIRLQKLFEIIRQAKTPYLENIPALKAHLTQNDFRSMRTNSEINNELKKIENELWRQVVNTETLLGDPLSQFSSDIFITEDNYGLTIDELIEIYKAQNVLYNPYNNRPFSKVEINKALCHPRLNQFMQSTQQMSKDLRAETIEQLQKLKDGLLNPKELSSDAKYLPIATAAAVQFNEFYQKLDMGEKLRLDNQWIRSYNNQKSMKFNEFFASMSEGCAHGPGFALRTFLEELPTSVNNQNRNSFAP